MPTDREREYYAMGFSDGFKAGKSKAEVQSLGRSMGIGSIRSSKPKRKLSAWNKFVKANSKKKIYRFANGKLKLKKMGIAFRKTRAGRKR
jgi:hypothetical protein